MQKLFLSVMLKYLRLIPVSLFLMFANTAHAVKLMDLPFRDGAIHVCRINLLQDSIRMFWKDDKGKIFGDFTQLNIWLQARKQTLACATNGGIYEESLRPLGLYVEEGRVLRRLNARKNAYGNFYLEPRGIFLVQGQQAQIVDLDTFQVNSAERLSSVRFATQSGPMLLQDGNINPQFSPQSANQLIRSAVCTPSSHEVVLALSGTPISFYDFARFLRDKLGCIDALHLDSKVSRLYPTANTIFAPPIGVIIAVTRPLD